MSTDPRQLERTLAEIERRLSRIETRLGMAGEAAPQRPVVAPEVPEVMKTAMPVVEQVVVPPPLPSATIAQAPNALPAVGVGAADAASTLEELARKRAAGMAARAEVIAGTRSVPPVAGAVVGRTRKQAMSVERAIGGKIAAYLGAIFMVIGLALGVTYGIKQGWFTLPPEMRCGGVALCGLALIAGGQIVRRRLGTNGNAASAGMAAVGIGAMYGAALAGWGMYELYGAPVAFALLAMVSVGGVGLGLWWKSLPLGVLALVGAYLNPLWLWMNKVDSDPMVLPVYLLALSALAIVLSAWRPVPYRMLRVIAWWGTALLGYNWVFTVGLHHPAMGIGFLALAWCIVHAELVLGSSRRSETEVVKKLGAVRSTIARPMRSSFATTVWAVGTGMIVAVFARVQIGLEEWHIAAGGFAGTLGLALVLAGHMRMFRDQPGNDRERLGVALWAQAGALLITTVALGVGGSMQVVAWLAMGVAAMAAGRWARARSLDVYGAVVLMIAVGRLGLWERWQPSAVHEAAGLVATWWTLLMAIGGAAWLAGAWMMHRPSEGASVPSARRRVAVDLAMGMGLMLAIAGCMFSGTVWQWMGAIGGVWAVVMFGAARWRESVTLRVSGIVGLGMLSALMALCHGLDAAQMLRRIPMAAWSMSIGELVVTAGSLTLVWIGVVWCAGAMLPRVRRTLEANATGHAAAGRSGSIAMVAVGVVMGLFAFVTEGTSQGAVCVAWTCVGAALVAAHAWKRMLAMDVMGLAACGLAGMMWCGAYVVDHNWLAETYAAFSHPGLWVGVLVSGAMIAAGVWLYGGRPRRGTWEAGVVAGLAVGGVMMLVCTSLEVARSAGILLPSDLHAQAAALTVWWGVCAGVMLVIGFVAGVPIVRHLGLGLLGLASVKAVVYDLAGVELGWRVVSFLGLGVLMMGVAIAYAKLSSRLERQAKQAADNAGGAGAGAGREWFPGA